MRVDANQLRCKVIGEGGNLGVSQQGRVEFSLNGGLINTDAIDNSGGVDCSDHEVNLKILLATAEQAGDMTRKHRNVLLASMAEEVCELVLKNNNAQNRALNAAVAEAPGMVQVHERFMVWLESSSGLTVKSRRCPAPMSSENAKNRGLVSLVPNWPCCWLTQRTASPSGC